MVEDYVRRDDIKLRRRPSERGMINLVIIGFFLFCHPYFVKMDLSEDSTYINIHNNQTCEELLEQFANTSASFMYCAVKFARPIKICEYCVHQYEDVLDSHDQILKVEDEKGNKVCKEKLMSLDRLEVIEEGFQYISDLWTRANCKYCFTDMNSSSSQLSNDTITFLNKLNYTTSCISQHSLGNGSYNESVCIDCEKTYCDLNMFYDNLKASQTEICMDIIDSMNLTRVLWSVTLSCVKEKQTLDIVLLVCSCVIASLPILFYLSAWIFITKLRNRLQMQKRLASLLRPSPSMDT